MGSQGELTTAEMIKRILGLEEQVDRDDVHIISMEAQAVSDRGEIDVLTAQADIDHHLIADLEAQGVIDRASIANLEIALTCARKIAAATGIIMAAHKVTEEQAFQDPRGASQLGHGKLRDVADDVVLRGVSPEEV
jgi:hypothetical protein